MAVFRYETHYAALLARGVVRDGECLLAQGARTSMGYVRVGSRRTQRYAHRVAYEVWHGPIAAGMNVDHECHNAAARHGECAGGPTCPHRSCVNPAHLGLLDWKENLATSPLTTHGGAEGPLGAIHRAKTACPRGHPYDDANTIRYRGARGCRECRRDKDRRRYWRQKAEGQDD